MVEIALLIIGACSMLVIQRVQEQAPAERARRAATVPDLDQNATEFDCFVTTSVDASGTPTGYHYQGSIDWTTGAQKIQYRPTT